MAATKRRKKKSNGGLSLAAATTLGELARRFGGVVDGGAEGVVVGAIAPIEIAGAGQLAPVTARRFVDLAQASAAALLVDAKLAELVPAGRRWVHEGAAHALARLLTAAFPAAAPQSVGAHVEEGAVVDPSAILRPGVVVLAGARIGAQVIVEPNAVVYGGVEIGARSIVGAGAVIGRPGFGWAVSPAGEVLRMPQLGGVVIEEDVEIGALATVDAGTLGPTVIERGAKLDAHVHVGHNAVIGAGALVAAQAGFAGSVEIGAGARVGGQVGVADHVRVGDGAELAAKAGVIGDVPAGGVVAGYPAVDRARWLRATAVAMRRKR